MTTRLLRRALLPLLLLVPVLSFSAAGSADGLRPDSGAMPSKDLHPALDPATESGALPFDLGAWESRSLMPLSNWPPMETDPPADVLDYDLDLVFGLADTTIRGTATLTVQWGNTGATALRLDLVGLPVTAVRDEHGAPLPFVQDTAGLDITPLTPPAAGEVVTLAIDYGGHPTGSFYNYVSAAYTFTEPEGSRYWFPCRDVPWDKATLSLHGRVPAGKILAGNGVLDSTTVVEGDPVYHWREDHPLATYLMAVAISNYAPVKPAWTVTPLTWYCYPADTALAAVSFQNVDHMVAFYDSTLVPYPFDKYAMCEASFGGGMEHQTVTLMSNMIFTAGLGYEWVTAHELAHQWFGDLVTCGGWGQIWLNEGFATFFEAVWQEAFYGPARFADRMANAQTQVFNAENAGQDHPIIDPPPQYLFSRIEYYKGAWVLNMLRNVMGKAAFDAGITEYLQTYAMGTAVTEDLQAIMEAHHGESLQWFFEPWLYGMGHPELRYTPVFGEIGDQWTVQLLTRQVQTSGTIFRYPLEVQVNMSGGQTVTETVWIEAESQVVSFFVPARPISVTMDPANKMLDENFLDATTGIDPVLPARLAAWPNPFRGRLSMAGAAPRARIDVFDLAGRRVRELTAGAAGDLVWDARDAAGLRLAPGAYFLRVEGSRRALRVMLLPGGD